MKLLRQHVQLLARYAILSITAVHIVQVHVVADPFASGWRYLDGFNAMPCGLFVAYCVQLAQFGDICVQEKRNRKNA